VILTKDFKLANPHLFVDYLNSDASNRSEFFSHLMSVASNDLALAHSIFKVSACNVALGIAGMEFSNESVIGAFGVNKSYDNVYLQNGTITGTKHWISNLEQGDVGVIQVQSENGLQLVLTELQSAEKDFSFLKSAGMQDTRTGDATFDQQPVTVLFARDDPKYFISNNHNNLCFVVNYLGAVKGLLDNMKNERLLSEYLNLVSLADSHIKTSSFETSPSNEFWHQRNSLYMASKQLLVDTLTCIIHDSGGVFYDPTSKQGKHFYDCLVYSSHNKSINENRKTLFVENQDY
jgi:hypothetical protein